MYPLLAAGDGLAGACSSAGPIASFEVLDREMATQFTQQSEQFSILPNSVADLQRQLRELTQVDNLSWCCNCTNSAKSHPICLK